MSKDNKPLKFKLVRINIDQFSLPASIPDGIEKFKLGTKVRFAGDRSNYLIGVFIQISFQFASKLTLMIECSCHFQIKKDSWSTMVADHQNKLSIPKELALHLSMITLGTTRGVLYSKSQNTPYNSLFIPLINPSELIVNDPIIIDLS